MTGMLASVTSVAEARIVFNAGIDVIDIKNPQQGALGALEINAVKDIVRSVNGKVITSATIGDISSDDHALIDYIINMAETGVNYVKVGLFDEQPSAYFVETIRQVVDKGIKLVIVIFAENYQGEKSLMPLFRTGIAGIMLDTREKKNKNLCALLNGRELKRFIQAAKQFNLITGIAGSLRYEDIAPLLELNSDYLGFRGALCTESNRVKTINEDQVYKIRAAIPLSEFNNIQNTQYKEAIIG